MVTDNAGSGIKFIPTWSKLGGIEWQEVVDFWVGNNAMPREMAIERAPEVAVLIRDSAEKLVGVSTAQRKQVRLLNNHYFFEVRCFIAPTARKPALDTMLLVATKQTLAVHRLVNGKDTIGLVLAIESDTPKRWSKAYWPGSDYYFIGFTSQGHHLRVSYFNDAAI